MSLDRTKVDKHVAEHIKSVRELQKREPTAAEKNAIRKQHERIATKVERRA